MNRREFIAKFTSVSLGAGALLSLNGFGGNRARGASFQSKVVSISHDGVWKDGRIDKDILADLLDQGMMELTGRDSSEESWKDYCMPEDIVGIKINPSSGRELSTHRELVDLVIERLKSVGVSEDNIIIWDRFEKDLLELGYEINVTKPGVKCYATDGMGPGYDERVYYEPEADSPPRRENGQVRSLFSRIVTEKVTKIINMPVLKHHSITGISGALKNIAFGSVNNTARFHPIEFLCDPAIPEIYSESVLRDKNVLNIVDALVCTYDGGPKFKSNSSWFGNRLLISADPVAVDKIASEMINAKRREKNLDNISAYIRHISTAGRMGLGNSSLNDITLKEISLSGQSDSG